MMTDPTTYISTIVGIARTTYAMVQQAEANKAQCQRLAERVKSIVGMLSALKEIPRQQRRGISLQYRGWHLNY